LIKEAHQIRDPIFHAKMWAGLLVVVPCAAWQVKGRTMVNDPEHIKALNSQPGSFWIAAPQAVFAGMTYDDARMLLGTALSHVSEHLNETRDAKVYEVIHEEDLPDGFDSRVQWPGLVHPIRDQQRCGSCWAFSASEVLSDRVAIADGKESPVLSPEDMVSCDHGDMGCQGGRLDQAWKYLTQTGIVTDSCMPYSAGNGDAPSCATTCMDSESFQRTKAKSAYAISGVNNMQKDIMMHGPIQAAFMVFKSFMSYQSGVYHKHSWEMVPEGGHAIKIVGWSMEQHLLGQVEYWLVANSWGISWGEDGFFRIVRGKDACGIESLGPPFAGLPAVTEDEFLVV